jgi:uncharacterized protein
MLFIIVRIQNLELDHMKMQPDRMDGVNVIARHEPGQVWVNAQPWTQSVLIPSRGQALAWNVATHAALCAQDFERIVAMQPELVIFGSGSSLRFVAPSLHQALFARRIGIETMDTAAACRTYNVLATEGRTVVAALLLEPATT